MSITDLKDKQWEPIRQRWYFHNISAIVIAWLWFLLFVWPVIAILNYVFWR